MDRKFEDLHDLLKTGFSHQPNQLSNNFGKFPETFHNKECTYFQCHAARRSFEDLFDISQTYFPETTEEELAKLLFQLN